MTYNFALAVARLALRGKERKYLTYDEINAALPAEKVSSEQIHQTLAMLADLDINIIESDEDEGLTLPETALHGQLEPMDAVLASLSPREERIIRSRSGSGTPKETLSRLGDREGLTRERIRQIEAKALRKLKHPSRSRKLRSFLDT